MYTCIYFYFALRKQLKANHAKHEKCDKVIKQLAWKRGGASTNCRRWQRRANHQKSASAEPMNCRPTFQPALPLRKNEKPKMGQKSQENPRSNFYTFS